MSYNSSIDGAGGIFLVLLFGVLILVTFGCTIYGLVLCFQASIILGLIVLILEPGPFIFGLLGIFGFDLAMAIQNVIHFPF
ncbi:hypothetical protein KAR91_00670 [Candidatus Pacearchaeota archaeon]|nr:hypothetical protein [Candidatus Pacearchaeota archaeon]